jgi:hypothetical protein
MRGEKLNQPKGARMSGAGTSQPRRWLRRGPWENAATAVIALGVVMLMQPFSIDLYGWSFAVILAGTVAFTVVGKFPD